ncbi:Sterol 3-beta-glucosyltransferase (Autophagy-related protein 26) [Durusdinium trenchii]|uniref:Sterol 3-beta-glucosyltransferase (Autophagy-related protein 26) n=1 Tax=Durusdinium trenchii TaxID=1381693 RepID=A0ABP0HTQ4_9DINO
MAKEHNLQFNASGVSAREITTSPEVVKAITANDFAQIAAIVGKQKEIHRAKNVAAVLGKIQSLKPELMICAGLNLSDCISVGRVLSIPVIYLSLQVMIPSNYLPALGVIPKLPSFLNMNWYAWKLVFDLVLKAKRKNSLPVMAKQLGTTAAEMVVSWEEFCEHCCCTPDFPVFFAVSNQLHPFPPDFSPMCRSLGPLAFQPEEQVGSDFGSTEECTRLEDFLKTCRQAGEEPVYVGYGSMIFESGKYMTLLSLRALRLANKRGVLLGGWAACSADDVENEPDTEELKAFCKEKVLFMDSAPHGRLFPHCQVIVHHGGAGTLYAAAMSGKPMVVVPVLMDQFVHSELVNQKQIGVGLKSMKSTTPNDLAAAISLCSSSSEIQQKAKALAEELAKEDGAKRLVEEVNGFFRDFIDTGCYVQKKNELNTRRSTMGWLKSLANLCSFC